MLESVLEGRKQQQNNPTQTTFIALLINTDCIAIRICISKQKTEVIVLLGLGVKDDCKPIHIFQQGKLFLGTLGIFSAEVL